jgi:general secretion pathway protein G
MTETLTPPKKRAPLRRRRRQRGITLLEIMIVLTIIGLVMALLVGPAAMNALFGSKVKTAKIQMGKFAFEAYGQWIGQHSTKHPPCPDSLSELTPFMENDDVNDPWGNPYIIKCEQNNKGQGSGYDFVVISYGADGKPGGTNNDADLDSRNLKQGDE